MIVLRQEAINSFVPMMTKVTSCILIVTAILMSGCSKEASEAESVKGAKVETNEVSATNGQSGVQIYQQVCMTCHDARVMEAPKFGDVAAWSDLIAEGYGVLVYESIKGEGNMPPRGGNPALTDMEVARAVAHLANAAGAEFVAPSTDEALQQLLQAAKAEVELMHEEDK